MFADVEYDFASLMFSACNIVIDTPGTEVTSQNYPGDYPASQDCTHVVRFTENRRVKLQFLSFETEKR